MEMTEKLRDPKELDKLAMTERELVTLGQKMCPNWTLWNGSELIPPPHTNALGREATSDVAAVGQFNKLKGIGRKKYGPSALDLELKSEI